MLFQRIPLGIYLTVFEPDRSGRLETSGSSNVPRSLINLIALEMILIPSGQVVFRQIGVILMEFARFRVDFEHLFEQLYCVVGTTNGVLVLSTNSSRLSPRATVNNREI